MEKYFYLTQYDEFGMFNEDIMEILEKNNQGVGRESLNQLLKIVPEVADRYNKELYEIMMSKGLDNDNIDIILEAWEHLADGELAKALDVLSIDYYRLLDNYDVIPFDTNTLEDIADEDLKANGTAADALYWYDKIYSDCIHVFNAYGNDFDYYDDMNELLDYYFDDCIKDDFIEALRNE